MKIDQKNIAIGFVISVILILILGYLISSIGIYLAIIIASAYAGYKVNDNIRLGMLHGTLIGLFSGIAVIAILYLRIGASREFAGALLTLSLFYIGVFIILGLVGGAIGYLIEKQRSNT